MKKTIKTTSDCPECGSTNVAWKIKISSVYGQFNTTYGIDASDASYTPWVCNDCGFKSVESFATINKRNERDNKIDEVINGI